MKKRISAFLMAIIMFFTIMPIQSTPVEATGTETQSIEFTLANSQGEILANSQVDCTVKLVSDKASVEQKQGIITTDKDGKGVLSITDATIIEAIKSKNEIEIEYIVMVDGYSRNALTVKYDKSKADFKLTALKLFSVTISSAYDDMLGTVKINGEKKVANESVYVTEGADAT